ncbi:hypothetical protein NZNM25_16450 [Nitrosopumilus zosterae]|uniref:Uncharacterized protein n=1 Tax=Nitrosopumilus zosterae TaxID=718286 RepID=A0A2S2KT82_9ARCH|nr:hypothetical protein [Nitrosopumilus zosterae]BDQ30042.1 hypothetical protein NZOSNM25_000133 [Nitrosopumilus zosterae]GBH34854.1 hypothetical protein NZNM25_16450 [Nitrosopumilus zosterae]
MISVKLVIFGFIGLLFSIGMIDASFAHTTVEVEQYHIEAGWGIEPPVVGIRNDIVFKITEPGETEGSYKGVTNVFRNVEATAMYGGAAKKIDINSDPRPGYYFSPIIPTKTGGYIMNLQGDIRGTIIDIKIPVEDVEPTAVLDFPPTSNEGTADITALKNALLSLQQDVSKLQSGETSVSSDGGAAYDFAIFGLSIAAAAIVLAIIALVKRK